uniref:DDE-type integrase/transposase/recombinase n=1 Tax=Desulforhopalus singaporensis TaxID=91360 RepID=UPI0015A361EB
MTVFCCYYRFFSRKIVGWSLNKRMTRQLVINALQTAIWHRLPSSGQIFHSDRGSQYCSIDFQRLLRKNKMKSSMSRRGDCWDTQFIMSMRVKLV